MTTAVDVYGRHPFLYHPELPARHLICGTCQLPRANACHQNLPKAGQAPHEPPEPDEDVLRLEDWRSRRAR